MSKRIVLVSGGKMEDDFALSVLKDPESSFIIGVDKGIEFLYRNGILPSYIVGDFDSVNAEVANYYRNETKVPIREFNPVKDASDTEIAIRLALTLGCRELVILGATGGRIDHLWANVQSLMIPFRAGVDAKIMDSQNCISLIGEGETIIRREELYGKYFSLFPLGREVYGLSISGAKYPLSGHTMTPNDSLCVSNQIDKDSDQVTISFQAGTVILMQTRDKEE